MRIIAGAAKGRRLVGPKGMTTRPMTDRAKEGLFSSIRAAVTSAQVLDLYAGSGSLGLEALSRGAAGAVFVEKNRAALSALRSNIEAVGLGGEVVAADVMTALRAGGPLTTRAPFDLVFVDPPYPDSVTSVEATLAALVPRLTDGALVVLHRRAGERPPEVEGLAVAGERTYGSAKLWRLVKEQM